MSKGKAKTMQLKSRTMIQQTQYPAKGPRNHQNIGAQSTRFLRHSERETNRTSHLPKTHYPP